MLIASYQSSVGHARARIELPSCKGPIHVLRALVILTYQEGIISVGIWTRDLRVQEC